MQSDPIGLAGGIDFYGYVYQSPMNYYDPDGLAAQGVAAAVAAAVIACAKNPSCIKKVADLCEGITSRAARRKAMRDRNVPTSRPTKSQTQNKDGTRQDSVDDSSGAPSVQSQHKADDKHPKPHWHSSKPKVDPVTGKARTNQHGNTKYESGGTVQNYD